MSMSCDGESMSAAVFEVSGKEWMLRESIDELWKAKPYGNVPQ